jgi:hypothetical protein
MPSYFPLAAIGLPVVRKKQSVVNPTFALRGLFATQPNYIWFACNNGHAKKA